MSRGLRAHACRHAYTCYGRVRVCVRVRVCARVSACVRVTHKANSRDSLMDGTFVSLLRCVRAPSPKPRRARDLRPREDTARDSTVCRR